MIGKTIEDLQVGDRAEFTKTISESDVYLYAGVTGDLNPAHINEEYAKKTFFKTRIAHGMLLGGPHLRSPRQQAPRSGHRLHPPGTEFPGACAHRGHRHRFGRRSSRSLARSKSIRCKDHVRRIRRARWSWTERRSVSPPKKPKSDLQTTTPAQGITGGVTALQE